jgi:hypothetical protein
MELASMLAAEPFSDRSGTVSPVIGAFLRTYNDGVGDERRQDLYPLASEIVATASTRAVEEERASRCLSFTRAVGGRLPAGRAALAMATPEASGSWAALAALRSGEHERALAFVRELVALRPAPPSGALAALRRLFAPDPAQAILDALADGPPPAARSRPREEAGTAVM